MGVTLLANTPPPPPHEGIHAQKLSSEEEIFLFSDMARLINKQINCVFCKLITRFVQEYRLSKKARKHGKTKMADENVTVNIPTFDLLVQI